jgi:hypothetical protein
MSCNADVRREMSFVMDMRSQEQRFGIGEWEGAKQELCVTIQHKTSLRVK